MTLYDFTGTRLVLSSSYIGLSTLFVFVRFAFVQSYHLIPLMKCYIQAFYIYDFIKPKKTCKALHKHSYISNIWKSCMLTPNVLTNFLICLAFNGFFLIGLPKLRLLNSKIFLYYRSNKKFKPLTFIAPF